MFWRVSECCAHQDMQVGAGHRTVMRTCPTLFVDRFAEAEIQRDMLVRLPFDTQIRSAAQAVGRRDGKCIEDIVLVEVNTVVPVTGIESLKAKP